MSKQISFFEVSYWCYYYSLGAEELDSMLASNNIDFEFFNNKPITDEQTKQTVNYLITRLRGL